MTEYDQAGQKQKQGQDMSSTATRLCTGGISLLYDFIVWPVFTLVYYFFTQRQCNSRKRKKHTQ